MKLNDIDNTLSEDPVSILKRAATKLKKHTPFNRSAREQAAGEEVTQKAANELAASFNTWLGKVKADPDIDPNNLTIEVLMDFFKDEGFAKTAQEVIKSAVKKNASTSTSISTDDPNDPEVKQGQTSLSKPAGMSDKEFADIKQKYNVESYKIRLANLLNEADDNSEITFSPQEVEKLILTIVSKVHRENPNGLAIKVRDMQANDADALSTQATIPSDARSTGVISDEEFDRIRSKIDNYAKNIYKAVDEVAEIKKENRAKIKAKIEKLTRDIKIDLS